MNRFFVIFVVLILLAFNTNAAVVLQYHHVDSNTPRSTSITAAELEAHLDWLEDNNFTVLPLLQVIDALKTNKQLPSSRIAVITFDDAYRSVCDTAWPVLKRRKLPFTLFVSTEPMILESSTQCSWEALIQIHKSGLLTIGNHSHHHAHLLELARDKSKEDWRKEVINHIVVTQEIIDDKFGSHEKIFAYPYGEYNEELKSIIKDLGYVAFGQQSGAIGKDSDFYALPRFSLSGNYADINLMADKLLSFPFPASFSLSADNPIAYKSKNNPPILTLKLTEPIADRVRCYLGSGREINITKKGNTIKVVSDEAFAKGRSRYNCTAASSEKGRFFWFSHQWVIE